MARKYDTRITAVRCKVCGVYTVGPEYGMCPKCIKPPVHLEATGDHRSVEVLKSTGFRPGAKFTLVEAEAMLKDGIWPLGTVIRMGGEIVAVCGVGKHYREPADKLPRQWTRRLA